ncbi:MAG: histidinol-phosphate transaminase [Candidatus Peregrinibacteria bacterium]
MVSPLALARPRIRDLYPYSSGRAEFSGNAEIFIDANENPFNTDVNRYPDVFHDELREKIAEIKNREFSCALQKENLLFGNGSNSFISLIPQIFCDAEKDTVVYCSPTFGMYSVSACIQGAIIHEVPLTSDFDIDTEVLEKALCNAKLLFLCSPNNPTGNTLSEKKILHILKTFSGIVVIDEAYIDFCPEKSMLKYLGAFPNLIIFHTFSKLWGLADARLGLAMAHPDSIQLLQRVQLPYGISNLSLSVLKKRMEKEKERQEERNIILAERKALSVKLAHLPIVKKVFPSDANFLLVQFFDDAQALYEKLLKNGIVVRNFAHKPHTDNCLRFTIGTPAENQKLISLLSA